MTTKRTRFAAAIGVAATAAMAAATLGSTPAHAEGVILGFDNPNAIDGKYIVAMNDGVSAAADLVAGYDGKVTDTFSSFDAFAVDMSVEDARALAADPAVKYVSQDAEVSISATQTNPPSWGLDRIDQTATAGDNAYTYPDSAGAGVTAYIIDTGGDLDHPDFTGRMSSGIDTVDNDSDASDCNGHGTHVAGTIGGDAYGVAKAANLVSVRVLNCAGSGTYAGVIAGIDWVTQNAQLPATANMSLGGGLDQAVNDAVSASIAAGVTYAVAAGNEYGSDACTRSPAATPEALTIAATDISDNRASFSNIGTCVDLFAPGVNITSAWLDGGENTISGTSMATPHVAGVATLHLGANPGDSPAAVEAAIKANALSGVVGDPGAGSPNLLLNMAYLNGGGGEPGEPGECAAVSGDAIALDDRATVESPLSVDCEGAASTVSVTVDITHTYRGDLTIELVSPDGDVYTLKEADITDSADDVQETYSVSASGTAAGAWTLRVIDNFYGDTGTLNGWSVEL